MPPWISKVMHGFIIIPSLFNTFYGRFDVKNFTAYAIAFTYTLGYYGLITHIFMVTGKWVYPFMNSLGVKYVLSGVFPITLVLVVWLQKLGLKWNHSIFPEKQTKKIQ